MHIIVQLDILFDTACVWTQNYHVKGAFDDT